MRMTRHDYDLLYRIYSSNSTRRTIANQKQADKLEDFGCLTISSSGHLHLTEYGKLQMQRVRGVGKAVFQVPRGYTLVPNSATPEMLAAARQMGPTFTALSYHRMLAAAPRVKT